MSVPCLHAQRRFARGNGNRQAYSPARIIHGAMTRGAARSRAPDGRRGDLPSGTAALRRCAPNFWQGFILANSTPNAAPFAPQVQTFETYFKSSGSRHGRRSARLNHDKRLETGKS